MTIKEFFENKKAIVVACPTREMAYDLMKRFHTHGYHWKSGKPYNKSHSRWDEYEKETCYSNGREYCYRSFYESRGYWILSYDELSDNPENNSKNDIGFVFREMKHNEQR